MHASIGDNHRYKLREALLNYRDNQASFITRHDVTVRKDATPTLGPAQPLTVAFIESLVRWLGGRPAAQLLRRRSAGPSGVFHQPDPCLERPGNAGVPVSLPKA